ncbi:hypothetical protein HCA24_07075 [Listeria innocua]|uniref:hypothetical protein n=1 Tax=Listeria innocua TaxID=1642 RepID=UPI0001EB8B6E|nr:hypothetical protein [Listeria innocua]OET37419.1 hypothetical protein AJL15_04680 [Listeria monocytogenes]EFR95347.1 hypothetical protein NT06LI_0105 [Listeria innocua FSL J1-023]MBC6148637.1 hypothetical protein [Listeria innocua]UVD65807.1 hypothetical protein MXK52_13365 [Listeria innocua]HAA0651429.1 hypothetical protein [Listeria innocua]
MDIIIQYAQNVLRLIDEEFPNQKVYNGIIRDIYVLTEKILKSAEGNCLITEKIDLNSLGRQFVDNGGSYNSPVILEFEKLVNQLKKLQENIK